MRIRTVGERAVLVSAMNPAALASVIRADAQSEGLELREVVPAARTVLVELNRTGALPRLRALLENLQESATEFAQSGARLSVPVRFDGPDLSDVAHQSGLSSAAVIALVTATPLTAAFTGFAPGFAYLTGLPAILHIPRRESPRTRVPAGTFAIASEYAAIYPTPSPGGWNLLGSTDLVLFDARREPAALISPGTIVSVIAR